jgi:hypothetical protein
MLAVAQTDPAGTDWTALRAAYAASPAYDPTTGDGPAMRDCIAATNTENWPEAAAEAQIAINQNFMDLRAHIFAVRAETALGNAAAANREAPIAIGMLHTILATGTGTSPATAYHVLATSEEYDIIRLFGFRPLGLQGLKNMNGHWYDVLGIYSPQSGASAAMWFNVDVSFARVTAIATGQANVIPVSSAMVAQ